MDKVLFPALTLNTSIGRKLEGAESLIKGVKTINMTWLLYCRPSVNQYMHKPACM